MANTPGRREGDDERAGPQSCETIGALRRTVGGSAKAAKAMAKAPARRENGSPPLALKAAKRLAALRDQGREPHGC